jgi:hypothetical protein
MIARGVFPLNRMGSRSLSDHRLVPFDPFGIDPPYAIPMDDPRKIREAGLKAKIKHARVNATAL